MTEEATRYARVQAIVGDALEQPEGRRSTFLDSACDGDPVLRAEVEELLALSDAEEDDALGEVALGAARRALDRAVDKTLVARSGEWIPESIEDYRILRKLGQGGMGIVYEAEQTSPRRRVAIKLLHPMLTTPERLKRFHQEAAVLGRLSHPGIAQVFEAGSADTGRGEQSFLVMELVEGRDLRTHCNRQGLDQRARVKLLAEVAEAIHHAHEHGVVHRDLKPDNVLVDSRGHPRILDFGIARVEGGSATLSTIVTEEGQLVGTLAYMAPEQLEPQRGQATRQVDVYALGVLGFELLAGRLPHDVVDLSLSQAIAVLTTRNVPRAGRVAPELRGDIETILGKALEPETSRRYATAAALAADLRRHLDHRPIHARPPGRIYLAHKFTQRHRGLVAGATATLLALLVGTVISLWFANDAANQRDLARSSERQAVNGLLQSAQVLLDAGQPLRAERQLRLVPEPRRGTTWHLLKRAVPHRIAASGFGWLFAGDTHLIGHAVQAGTEDALELLVYSLASQSITRRMFSETGLRRVVSTSRTGISVGRLQEEPSKESFAVLDMNRERVLLTAPVFMLESEVTIPKGSDRAGERQILLRERMPELSDDGRTLLWFPKPNRAEIRVDLEVVHVVNDLLPADSVHLGPNGLSFAVSRSDELTVRDVRNGSLQFHYEIPPSAAATAFPVDGGVLLANSMEGDRFSRPVKWKRLPIPPPGKLESPSDPFAAVEPAYPGSTWPTHVSWPHDGRYVAVTGPGFPGGRLVDTSTGAPLRYRQLVDEGGFAGRLQISDLQSPSMVVSPDGSRIAYVDAFGQTEVVELDPRESDPSYHLRGPVFRGHAGPSGNVADGWIYQLAISDDGSLLASSAPMDPLVRIWDTRTGESLSTLDRDCGTAGSLDALLAFSPGSERLLISTPWSTNGLSVVSFGLIGGSVELPVTDLPIHTKHTAFLDPFLDALAPRDSVRLNESVALHRGRILTTHSSGEVDGAEVDGGEITVRETTGGKHPRWSLSRRDSQLDVGIGPEPAGSRVAIARQKIPGVRGLGTIVIADLDTEDVVAELALSYKPWCCAFSPDGTMLAVGTDEGHVLLFDTETWTQELDWVAHSGHYDYVHALTWTPDGTRLVTASGDATLRVWDTRTRVAARIEDEAWRALRASMAAREDLAEIYPSLEGEQRAAARAELMLRRSGD